MTDSDRLLDVIKLSGIPKAELSRRIGLKSPLSLENKIRNRTEFTASEIDKLCKILRIKTSERMAIFFKPDVTKRNADEQ